MSRITKKAAQEIEMLDAAYKDYKQHRENKERELAASRQREEELLARLLEAHKKAGE